MSYNVFCSVAAYIRKCFIIEEFALYITPRVIEEEMWDLKGWCVFYESY